MRIAAVPALLVALALPRVGVAQGSPARSSAEEVGSEAARPSIGGRVLRTAVGVGGGVLVGSWLGYFVSQVGRSDWEKITPEERSQLRQRYARSGAALGAVVGYFLRPAPPARNPTGIPQPPGIPPREGRQLLAASDLRRTIATNVLEAVELARPEWISALREDERRAGPRKASTPVEATSVMVYVGDERVGTLESLRDIALPEVVELRYYDAHDARRRWGFDHRYGAIEVVPAESGTAAPADSGARVPAVPAPR